MRKWLLLALALALPLGASGSAALEELHPFVRGSWQEIRKAHAGQPTVVHFWGVTCGPCRVEMPAWGKLLQERPDLNLVVINADLVPNEPSAVSAMLAQTGLAGAENWMFTDSFVERLRYESSARSRNNNLAHVRGTGKSESGDYWSRTSVSGSCYHRYAGAAQEHGTGSCPEGNLGPVQNGPAVQKLDDTGLYRPRLIVGQHDRGHDHVAAVVEDDRYRGPT